MFEKEFEVSIVGEFTGEKWTGTFKVKTLMSMSDTIRADQIRRELLGANPSEASILAINMAEIFSQLQARVIKAPTWWTEKRNGLDLVDTNVALEIYNTTIAAEKEVLDARAKKAEAIKSELAAMK